jgi:hypothetical protein
MGDLQNRLRTSLSVGTAITATHAVHPEVKIVSEPSWLLQHLALEQAGSAVMQKRAVTSAAWYDDDRLKSIIFYILSKRQLTPGLTHQCGWAKDVPPLPQKDCRAGEAHARRSTAGTQSTASEGML